MTLWMPVLSIYWSGMRKNSSAVSGCEKMEFSLEAKKIVLFIYCTLWSLDDSGVMLLVLGLSINSSQGVGARRNSKKTLQLDHTPKFVLDVKNLDWEKISSGYQNQRCRNKGDGGIYLPNNLTVYPPIISLYTPQQFEYGLHLHSLQ